MLRFVRSFVPHRGSPIGVDLGARTVRLAQVGQAGDELSLIHAHTFDAPAANDPDGWWDAVAAGLRSALKNTPFLGRQVAVALPASAVTVKHVRVAKGGEAASQARDAALAQLGATDPSDWHVRHVVAGDVFGDGGSPQQEAVAFATPQDAVDRLLRAAEVARVELVGVQVQPRVLVEAFGHFHRRKADADAVNLYVDLGADGTRAVVAAPVDVKFVRAMPVNVREIHERIAKSLKMPAGDVATLRRLSIAQQTGRSNEISAAAPTPTDPQIRLHEATAVEARRLADELDLCRRYHEATFPSQPVSRLVFVGGGARDRLLCAAVAQAMGLPAQIGDPLVRFNRAALPALGCIDRREPQPEWSIAIGLSLCGRTVAATSKLAA